MKKILLFSLLLLSAALRAQDDTRRQIDSLSAAIPAMPPEQRYDAYYDLRDLYNAMGDMNGASATLHRYIEDARREGNMEYLGKALLLMAYHYNNYNLTDSLRAAAGPTLDFFAEHGQWGRYYTLRKTYILSLLVGGQLDEGIAEARAMFEFAKARDNDLGKATALMCMGLYYQTLNDMVDAEKHHRESVAAFRKVEMGNGSDHLLAYKYLSSVLNAVGKHAEALEVCKECDAKMDYYRNLSGKNPIQEYNLACEYARAYLELGDKDKTRHYLERIRQSPVMAYPSARQDLMFMTWRMYELEGKYDLMLQVQDSLFDLALETGDVESATGTLREQGRSAYKAGNYKKSAEAYRRFWEMRDSLVTQENEARISELSTLYEVDKLEMQKRAQFNYLLLALGLCLLLAILLVSWILYSRNLARKNRTLIDRLGESEPPSDDGPGTPPLPSNERQNPLYAKLKALIGEKRPYTDPSLGRRELALMLGTNERYLLEVVRSHYGLSVGEYINGLRLNYARELLSAPAAGDTIEDVAIRAGFGSRNTLYRHFRNQYGMTPDEYRRQAPGS